MAAPAAFGPADSGSSGGVADVDSSVAALTRSSRHAEPIRRTDGHSSMGVDTGPAMGLQDLRGSGQALAGRVGKCLTTHPKLLAEKLAEMSRDLAALRKVLTRMRWTPEDAEIAVQI